MYLLWKMEWHKIFYTRVSRDIINLWGKINYQYLLRQVFTSVVYDKVRNRKNYFEIPVYLLIEWGISKAGKFKVLLHFPAPEFACIFVFIWISGLFFKNQKGGTSKIIFPIPSYITKGAIPTSATVQWHWLLLLSRSIKSLESLVFSWFHNQKVSKWHWLIFTPFGALVYNPGVFIVYLLIF